MMVMMMLSTRDLMTAVDATPMMKAMAREDRPCTAQDFNIICAPCLYGFGVEDGLSGGIKKKGEGGFRVENLPIR